LRMDVAVPHAGELLVLSVQVRQDNAVLLTCIARILLDAEVVVTEILCEAPDYVELKPDTWRALSI